MGEQYIVLVTLQHSYTLNERDFPRFSKVVVVLTDSDVPEGKDPLTVASEMVVADEKRQFEAAKKDGMQVADDWRGMSVTKVELLPDSKVLVGAEERGKETPAV